MCTVEAWKYHTRFASLLVSAVWGLSVPYLDYGVVRLCNKGFIGCREPKELGWWNGTFDLPTVGVMNHVMAREPRFARRRMIGWQALS